MSTCPTETHTPLSIKKTTSKKNRCSFPNCKKKIKLVDEAIGKCKCDHLYCRAHKDPNNHSCTYDWHLNDKKLLADRLLNEKCVAPQISAI
jgi:hypothetical protein